MHWKLRVWIVWDRNWDLTCANKVSHPTHPSVSAKLHFTTCLDRWWFLSEDVQLQFFIKHGTWRSTTCRWFLYLRGMRLHAIARVLLSMLSTVTSGTPPTSRRRSCSRSRLHHKPYMLLGAGVLFAFGRTPLMILMFHNFGWITVNHMISHHIRSIGHLTNLNYQLFRAYVDVRVVTLYPSDWYGVSPF